MPLLIKTIEHLQGDYGLYTWPCAPVLAHYVYSQRDFIKGKRVLELGAGTAIPGLVAAKCGAHVTLSDREDDPCLLDNLKQSCDLNKIPSEEVKIIPITWGIFSPALLELEPQDLILASDCFYDSKDFEDIIAMVAYFFKKNPACRFWTTYQERSSNRNLHHLFVRWDMQCRSIPMESFYSDVEDALHIEGPSERKLTTNHTIHMWEIISRKHAVS